MNFLKFLGIGSKKKLTKEEKISRAKKKYTGWALVSAILEIEGIGDRDPRLWYRLVDLCAEYQIDFVIPCSE